MIKMADREAVLDFDLSMRMEFDAAMMMEAVRLVGRMTMFITIDQTKDELDVFPPTSFSGPVASYHL
jgi:hypothetical protein